MPSVILELVSLNGSYYGARAAILYKKPGHEGNTGTEARQRADERRALGWTTAGGDRDESEISHGGDDRQRPSQSC